MNTKRVIDLASLGGRKDHKMSKEEILMQCVDRIDWLQKTLFGGRDEKGNLIKVEHKDKDGKVISVSYETGLLQKFEGAWEMEEGKSEPILRQKGMEQLFQELGQSHNLIAKLLETEIFQLKVLQVFIFIHLGINPEDLNQALKDKETEINVWMQNFKSIVEREDAKFEQEANQTAEKLKDFKPDESKIS